MDTSPSALGRGASTEEREPLVQLRGVEKSFDHGAGRFHVLRRIDLDVRPGEFVSVMGPSGAGKSTLLHLLGVQVADEPTGNLHSEQAHEIMRLFQSVNTTGTTIVQVTHSEENARHGRRIVRVRDGWIDSDEPRAARA